MAPILALNQSSLQVMFVRQAIPHLAMLAHKFLHGLLGTLRRSTDEPKVRASPRPYLLPGNHFAVCDVERRAIGALVAIEGGIYLHFRQDILEGVAVGRFICVGLSRECDRGTGAMDLPEQGKVKGNAVSHVHCVGSRDESHDPVGSDFRERPARTFGKLHQKIVLSVVEDVVSPWFWDARHLLVKGRLDLDLVRELQAISFATGLKNDSFKIGGNGAYGKHGCAWQIYVDLL